MKMCPYCKQPIYEDLNQNTSPIQYDDKGRLCHAECWNEESENREETTRTKLTEFLGESPLYGEKLDIARNTDLDRELELT